MRAWAAGSIMLRGDLIGSDGGFNIKDFWPTFTFEGCLKLDFPIDTCAVLILTGTPQVATALKTAKEVAELGGLKLDLGTLRLELCSYITTLGNEETSTEYCYDKRSPFNKKMPMNPGVRGKAAVTFERTMPFPVETELKCTILRYPGLEWNGCCRPKKITVEREVQVCVRMYVLICVLVTQAMTVVCPLILSYESGLRSSSS